MRKKQGISEKINRSAITINEEQHSDYSSIEDTIEEQNNVLIKCDELIKSMGYKVKEGVIVKMYSETQYDAFIKQVQDNLIKRAPDTIASLIANQTGNKDLLRNVILVELKLLLKNTIIQDNIYRN